MKNPLSSYQAVCRPGLFATAAFMALANSVFALTVPKPVRTVEETVAKG